MQGISSSIFQWLADRERAWFLLRPEKQATDCSACRGRSSHIWQSLLTPCLLFLLLLFSKNNVRKGEITSITGSMQRHNLRIGLRLNCQSCSSLRCQRVASHKQTTSVRISLSLMLLIAHHFLVTLQHLVKSYNSKSETTTRFALRLVYGFLMARHDYVVYHSQHE